MIGWLDCSSGCSGDMFLAALHGAGVPLSVMSDAVESMGLGLSLQSSSTTRGGLAAVKVDVVGAGPDEPRHLSEILTILDKLEPAVRTRAAWVFGTIATAEAAVHGVSVEDVHFHEVGALDALADVVGACAGLAHLGLSALHATPPALGGGRVSTSHGTLPVPVPAVVEILRLAAAPSVGGPLETELTTPTGAALLAVFITDWGPQPALTVTGAGYGAGTKDFEQHANVLRLLVGDPAAELDRVILETTVDDLEPRIWPFVIERLLELGVDDAWIVPSLGKKDRIGSVLTVLCPAGLAERATETIFAETSTLGVRRTQLAQRDLLDRDFVTVEVDGHPVRIKRGWLHGRVITSQPEWEDVAAAARATGRPAKDILAAALKLC